MARLAAGRGRRAAVVGLALFLAVCVGFSGMPASAQSQRPVQWDWLWFVPLTDGPVQNHLLDFVELVKEKTGGRLDITVRPVGEMPYDPTEYIRVVGDGLVEMADGYVGLIAGDIGIAELPQLPFLARTKDELYTTMDIILPQVEEEFDRHGLALLYWYVWPEQQIWGSGKPVTSLQDFRGMTVRTPGREPGEFFRRLGATPITIAAGEVPAALERGLMQGVITTAMTVLPFGWYEHVDWGYIIDMQFAPGYIIVNKQALAALPADVREGLLEASREAHERAMRDIIAAERDYIRQLEERGVTVNYMDVAELEAVQDILDDIWTDWARRRGPVAGELLQQVREAIGR